MRHETIPPRLPSVLLWIAVTLLYLLAHAASGAVPESAIIVVAGGSPLPPVRDGNKLLVSPLYLASLNPQTKCCDWVQYRVTPALMDTGNVLTRNWRTSLNDDALESSDYEGGPYDRGHLVPLACVAASTHAADVNRMEVIAPQTPALNRGAWLRLEEHIRDLARDHGVVCVTVGTLYERRMAKLPNADEPHRVPSHFWIDLTAGTGPRAVRECYLVPQQIDPAASYTAHAIDPLSLRQKQR